MRVWRVNDVAGAIGLLGRATVLLPAGARRGGAAVGAVDRAPAARTGTARRTLLLPKRNARRTAWMHAIATRVASERANAGLIDGCELARATA